MAAEEPRRLVRAPATQFMKTQEWVECLEVNEFGVRLNRTADRITGNHIWLQLNETEKSVIILHEEIIPTYDTLKNFISAPHKNGSHQIGNEGNGTLLHYDGAGNLKLGTFPPIPLHSYLNLFNKISRWVDIINSACRAERELENGFKFKMEAIDLSTNSPIDIEEAVMQILILCTLKNYVHYLSPTTLDHCTPYCGNLPSRKFVTLLDKKGYTNIDYTTYHLSLDQIATTRYLLFPNLDYFVPCSQIYDEISTSIPRNEAVVEAVKNILCSMRTDKMLRKGCLYRIKQIPCPNTAGPLFVPPYIKRYTLPARLISWNIKHFLALDQIIPDESLQGPGWSLPRTNWLYFGPTGFPILGCPSLGYLLGVGKVNLVSQRYFTRPNDFDYPHFYLHFSPSHPNYFKPKQVRTTEIHMFVVNESTCMLTVHIDGRPFASSRMLPLVETISQWVHPIRINPNLRTVADKIPVIKTVLDRNLTLEYQCVSLILVLQHLSSGNYFTQLKGHLPHILLNKHFKVT